jgi:hypothetical protein
MSSKRKSISISGVLYARLKEHALRHAVSISSIVEKVVAPDLEQDPPAYSARRGAVKP